VTSEARRGGGTLPDQSCYPGKKGGQGKTRQPQEKDTVLWVVHRGVEKRTPQNGGMGGIANEKASW